jgi:hypothetical protein
MAVTPNTTFSSGAILTAAQMNRFGRGIMATPATSTTTDSTITTTEEVMLTYTFTAVSGRMYQITYVEPSVLGTVATTLSARLREDSLTGATINQIRLPISTTLQNYVTMTFVFTAAASGSKTVVATLLAGANTVTATRGATNIAALWAVDIGAS